MKRINFSITSWLAILAVMLSFSTWAEQISRVKNLSLQQISVEQGLSQGTVKSILASKNGLVWFATENGLNFYDGYSIKQLSGPNNQFVDTRIHFVKEDKQGWVWINASNGLYRFEPKNNNYQQPFINELNHFAVDVIEGKNNQGEQGYWIATTKKVGFYSDKKQKFIVALDLSKELIEQNNIFQIIYVNQMLYVATRVGVYAYSIDSEQWKKLPSTSAEYPDNSVSAAEANNTSSLFLSQKNDLYIGSNDGVYCINTDNIRDYIQGKSSLSNYQQVIEDISARQFLYANNQLYIASNKGLYKFNISTRQAEFLFGFSDYFDDVSNNLIISLAQDNSGTFWLGSLTSGVYLWDPSRELIRNYRYKKGATESLSNNAVWALREEVDDSFWVGTSQGFNFVDNVKGTIEKYMVGSSKKSQYSKNHIYQIYHYKKDHLILATAKGILLYNTGLKKVINWPFSKAVIDVLAKKNFSPYLQENRYLWLVEASKISRIDLVTGKLDNLTAITTIVPAAKIYKFLGLLPNTQRMLFSTNDSLWEYDLETQETNLLYKHPDVAASEWGAFDDWVVDKNGVFWLGYPTKGLLGLELSSFKVKYFYHNNNSIIDNNVYSLLTDEDGDLWFSTHKGLFLLDVDSQHLRQFTTFDGLPAMEFNSGAKGKLPDGKLMYGSMEGVSVFEPNLLKNKQSNRKIEVFVTGINIISRELVSSWFINQKEEVLLQHDDVGIQFDFSTLSYADRKNNVVFEYELRGVSSVKYPATTENKITFSSLPSGQHVLSIRAKSPVTGKYSKTKNIKIRVSYPPFLSPLAYVLYTVFSLGVLLIWIYNRNVQRQQLLESHREVRFRENRLQLALAGSNSEVWDWQSHDNLMFGKRIAQELGYVDLATSHSLSQHIELIHPDDRKTFVSTWQTFIEENEPEKTFSCTYRLQHSRGHWLWYKDLGKIVSVDKHDKPSRITGSYTNITKNRDEEMRSQYYGEAFKQTTDWVLIVNQDFTRVTANQSMRTVFGWKEENFKFNSKLLGLTRKKWLFYNELFTSLGEGEHWRGEELVITDSGQEFHVLVNINVGTNKTTKQLHYVCVLTDISAQKAAEKELRYLANYDHLTDLPNRSLLLERIKHATDIAKRKGTSIALFFIDLDRFKQVNDSLGHDCGDLLLVEVTRRLSDLLRVDDTIARIGGDEFVVLLESFRSSSELGKIAQKIIACVEQPVELSQNQVSIGASVGISLYPNDADDCISLLRHADVAMYHAKQLGRNTFQFFTPRMNKEANERLTKESNVKLAYSNDEFFNHYQPIINANKGKAVGFELLMRWQKNNTIVAPGAFIDIAEELGIIVSMTEAALERGLKDLKKWHKLRPALYLSVNLSPKHFAKENLVGYISTQLKAYDLPAHLLKIEVTESALLSEPEKSIRTMQALSKLGVILALDDFGTGFSSLSYLKRLPLDIIKIDRSFVSGIGEEKTDEAIVDATLVLAKRLNMHCIAEGVETITQLKYLTERDCNYIQGYLYSKPVDAKTISEYLAANTTEIKTN
ncbi:MAG: EAL domain-containing protein [Litorilituus sp.]|nr:EAL domain-containing protein [Litorilituus sp.]